MRRDFVGSERLASAVVVFVLFGALDARAQVVTKHAYLTSVSGETITVDGRPQIAVQTIELPAGQTLDPARHLSEVAVVVISGSVMLDGRRLNALDAVYAPKGEPIDATAVEPAHLLQFEWIDGFEGTGKRVIQARKELTHQESKDVESTISPYFDKAHPALSLTLVEAQQGAELQHPRHLNSVEHLVVIAGKLRVKSASGQWTLKAGDYLRLTDESRHHLVAIEPLVALQVLAPRTK